MFSATRRTNAFSLIELVIVVVIIGIIAAIAIPRMSRGATGANDNALVGNLAVLRKAIDLYQAEHGGSYPTVADFEKAMTLYSNEAGDDFNATKDATHVFGPYMRAVPPLTVGAKKGSNGVAAVDGAGVGWIYDANAGTIKSNTTEKDATGRLYNTY